MERRWEEETKIDSQIKIKEKQNFFNIHKNSHKNKRKEIEKVYVKKYRINKFIFIL